MERLLLKWFTEATEQERIPLFTTTNFHSSGLALCTGMAAEEAGAYVGTEPFDCWLEGPADSDAPEVDEDVMFSFKFMMWKAPGDSVHCIKE